MDRATGEFLVKIFLVLFVWGLVLWMVIHVPIKEEEQ